MRHHDKSERITTNADPVQVRVLDIGRHFATERNIPRFLVEIGTMRLTVSETRKLMNFLEIAADLTETMNEDAEKEIING